MFFTNPNAVQKKIDKLLTFSFCPLLVFRREYKITEAGSLIQIKGKYYCLQVCEYLTSPGWKAVDICNIFTSIHLEKIPEGDLMHIDIHNPC